jgi:TetR/AcrR family transcriptional regulator, regulator of cefoperazone and chloramphenicol sensitivity
MNTFLSETPSMPHADLRRQRGRRTRERLIIASLKLFGAHSFKAVTTRSIARAACANQASILYHFGGKRQLYLTVADRIATEGRAALQPLLEKSRQRPVGFEPARSLLIEIVMAFARQLCGCSDDGAAASFVARELASPESGYPTIYESYIRDVHEEVTSLLAKTTARYPREHGAIIDAHALMGAVLSFVAARKTFAQRSLRRTDREERIEAIVERIGEITTRITERKLVPRPVRPLPASPLLSPRNRPRGPRNPHL